VSGSYDGGGVKRKDDLEEKRKVSRSGEERSYGHRDYSKIR